MQKQEAEKVKVAAKIAVKAVKEEVKVLSTAEHKVKVKVKGDARQQKEVVRLEKEREKEVAEKEKEKAREEVREKRAAEKMKVRKGNDAQKTTMTNDTTLTMADVEEGYNAGTTVMGRGESNKHPEKPVSVPQQ